MTSSWSMGETAHRGLLTLYAARGRGACCSKGWPMVSQSARRSTRRCPALLFPSGILRSGATLDKTIQRPLTSITAPRRSKVRMPIKIGTFSASRVNMPSITLFSPSF